MDEIWLLAVSEAYRAHRMRTIDGRSRPEVIAWYFAENPEIKRWVDRSIEAGTCADAKAELRAKNEEFRQWLHEQREDLPMPERNPDFDWMDEFRMKPREISALPAPAKNAVGSDKPRPTNQAVRQWVRDRVTSWPDDKSTPSEDDDWNAARRHFAPGLSRDEFRTVRNSETPTEWRKQGRRKLNPRIRGPQISAELDGRSKLPFVVLATHGALREHGAINGRTYEIFGRGFSCGTAIRFCADHSTLAGNWRGTAVHQGGRAACDL